MVYNTYVMFKMHVYMWVNPQSIHSTVITIGMQNYDPVLFASDRIFLKYVENNVAFVRRDGLHGGVV